MPIAHPVAKSLSSRHLRVRGNRDGGSARSEAPRVTARCDPSRGSNAHDNTITQIVRFGRQRSATATPPLSVPTEGRTDWQRKLDTDFMADPRHVSPEELRDIAKMNNDANKLQASDDDYSHLNSLD